MPRMFCQCRKRLIWGFCFVSMRKSRILMGSSRDRPSEIHPSNIHFTGRPPYELPGASFVHTEVTTVLLDLAVGPFILFVTIGNDGNPQVSRISIYCHTDHTFLSVFPHDNTLGFVLAIKHYKTILPILRAMCHRPCRIIVSINAKLHVSKRWSFHCLHDRPINTLDQSQAASVGGRSNHGTLSGRTSQDALSPRHIHTTDTDTVSALCRPRNSSCERLGQEGGDSN